jgi:hemoglobin/transferrin/lactoferrin receptor protein
MLGQSVKVLHYKTKEPIKDVQVHNRDKSISLYTNIEGIVSLNDFKINELVYFSHPSFEKEKKSISQIVTDGYRVLMFDLIELPTIVIKPPRENTHEDFSSVRIDKINSFDIQFSSPQTSADMLQKNSNILVQKSQDGGGSPIIRGFEANKI